MQDDQPENLNRFQRAALSALQQSVDSKWFKNLKAQNAERKAARLRLEEEMYEDRYLFIRAVVVILGGLFLIIAYAAFQRSMLVGSGICLLIGLAVISLALLFIKIR